MLDRDWLDGLIENTPSSFGDGHRSGDWFRGANDLRDAILAATEPPIDDDRQISLKAAIEALQSQLDAMPQSVTTDTKGHLKREMDFEQGARGCLMHNIEMLKSLSAAEPSSATELFWEEDSENNQINTDGWTITFWEGCGDETCHKSTWQLAYNDDDFTVERDDPEELKRIAAKIVAALDDKGER